MTIHYAPPSAAGSVRAVFGPSAQAEGRTRSEGPGAGGEFRTGEFRGEFRTERFSGDLHRKSHLYRGGLKRALDVVLVLLGAVVVLPLLAILALLVASDGAAPFYRQQRIGRGGRLYTMWKLRSMVPDAEARLQDHLDTDPAARAEWDSTQKLKHDPRITPVGRLLRKCSLDELPQLWNVLKGDMSLVGPRPMLPEQAPLYPGRAYYALRPGITGPWQVSSRNESSFADRAWFDAAYERALSPLTDLRLLAATARVVIRGTGY